MQDPEGVAEAAAELTALGLPVEDGPERLGGMTNRVYRAGRLVLRLPGAGTEAYIDRAAELVAARAAAAAGVAPPVVRADAARGVMVTERVPGVTMTPALFAARKGAPGRAGTAFALLHASDARFAARFELFAMIDSYLAVLAPRAVALPAGWDAVLAAAEALRPVLTDPAIPLAPCHCDPLCENFLDTGARMWIVDWEYSGMNDPMWDLADLSVEAGFTPAQEDEMLLGYFGRPAPMLSRARMVTLKAMCDLLWTLWGLIQLSDGNPAEDFRAYAEGRFARCRALMQTAEFHGAVRTLGA
ncbi:choline/ethanolamine kinase family protein [Frigidibacter sp. MR17.14]|uniref:choline/ethanolamine kinase family protein n=1 Tax=Frigidibacter sp. MR17.14 TaxID=3126509 RepID=UPI003012DE22